MFTLVLLQVLCCVISLLLLQVLSRVISLVLFDLSCAPASDVANYLIVVKLLR